MRSLVVAALIFGATMLANACDDGDGEPEATVTAAFTSTPTSTAPAGPSASADPRRTGIADVDSVIETLFTGDTEAARALIQFTSVACEAQPEGLGARPQCPSGVEDGTPIEVFPTFQCEGFYVSPEDIESTVTTLSSPGPTLVAAYGAAADASPESDYALVYSGVNKRRPEFAYGVYISGGRVVGIHLGCAMTPETFAEFFGLFPSILEPVRDAPITRERTGIQAIDDIIDAVETGDTEAVVAAMRFLRITCIATPEELPVEPPCDGDPHGTLVEAMPFARCEGGTARPPVARHAMRRELSERFGSRLYGVYPANGSDLASQGRSFFSRANATYVIVFSDSSAGGWGLLLNDEGVVGLAGGCSEDPASFVDGRGLRDPLVGPLATSQ